MTTAGRLGVALIGHAFMGRAHTQAWARLGLTYPLPVRIDRVLLCGRDHERSAGAAAELGWAEASDDWRTAVERDDIDVVDICTPVASHAEIAIAALRAGKHVVCEKPLALDGAQAAEMVEAERAAAARGAYALCGFNYRRVPALAHLQRLVADGRLGRVRQLRATYDQDWGADPDLPINWRFRAAEGGSGALADLGSHLIDLARFITGAPLTRVVGTTTTVVPRRPVAPGSTETVAVDVDDAVAFLATTAEGMLASFEATRTFLGRKNALVLQVSGERGSAVFDLERLNELSLFLDGDDDTESGFRRVLVTDATHPYLGAWWPPGHTLGWEHSFVHELHDFVTALLAGQPPEPGFAAAAYVQGVIDTVLRAGDAWTAVPEPVRDQ